MLSRARSRLALSFSIAAALNSLSMLAVAEPAPSDRATAPVTPPPQNPSSDPAARAPAYSQVRWDENYSYLRDPSLRSDPLDTLKYIPIGDDSYLSVGGQARDRYEFFNHSNFGRGPQDPDGYNLFRFTPYLDLHLTPYFRVFGQFRTADESWRTGGPRGRDEDSADLQQGFFEFDRPDLFGNPGDSFALRAGRQQMVFGRERLIGIADFSNANRNFDGVRATLNTGRNTLDLFWVQPVTVEKYEFDDAESHTNFAGVYDTVVLSGTRQKPTLAVSFYGLGLFVNSVARWPDAPSPGDEERYTLGNEIRGSFGNFDYDAENDYQLGTFNGEQIGAFSTAEEIGYTFPGAPLTPRPYLGFDLASGDHDSGNGHLGTFNQLFPTGHAYFGYMDFIGRENIIDLHPGLELTLLKNEHYARKLSLRSEYHQFWRESVNDAVYDAGGAVLIKPNGTHGRDIGSELDLLLDWQITRHWSSYIGYSHFWPGAFVQDTGSSKDVDFFYSAVAFTF